MASGLDDNGEQEEHQGYYVCSLEIDTVHNPSMEVNPEIYSLEIDAVHTASMKINLDTYYNDCALDIDSIHTIDGEELDHGHLCREHVHQPLQHDRRDLHGEHDDERQYFCGDAQCVPKRQVAGLAGCVGRQGAHPRELPKRQVTGLAGCGGHQGPQPRELAIPGLRERSTSTTRASTSSSSTRPEVLGDCQEMNTDSNWGVAHHSTRLGTRHMCFAPSSFF